MWVKRFKLKIWRTLTINIFQEQLAVAAQNAVSTIVQLSDVVKAGAASLGSPNQEAQVKSRLPTSKFPDVVITPNPILNVVLFNVVFNQASLKYLLLL